MHSRGEAHFVNQNSQKPNLLTSSIYRSYVLHLGFEFSQGLQVPLWSTMEVVFLSD